MQRSRDQCKGVVINAKECKAVVIQINMTCACVQSLWHQAPVSQHAFSHARMVAECEMYTNKRCSV
jgi:hypothetical protein